MAISGRRALRWRVRTDAALPRRAAPAPVHRVWPSTPEPRQQSCRCTHPSMMVLVVFITMIVVGASESIARVAVVTIAVVVIFIFIVGGIGGEWW